MTRWESLDTIFKALERIRLSGKFALYPHGNEVLGTAAAVIVEEKRRWDNRSEIEKDGICLSTLVQRFHHLECSNILDKVYGLLGLSCEGHRLEVDYDKSPLTVCEEVLKIVYNTQLFEEHARVLFEDLLRSIFGLDKITRARATMEDTAGGTRYGRWEDIDRRIYRTSQPISGKPEFEVGYTSSLFLWDSEAQERAYRFGGSWSLPEYCWTPAQQSRDTPAQQSRYTLAPQSRDSVPRVYGESSQAAYETSPVTPHYATDPYEDAMAAFG